MTKAASTAMPADLQYTVSVFYSTGTLTRLPQSSKQNLRRIHFRSRVGMRSATLQVTFIPVIPEALGGCLTGPRQP